MGVLDWIKGTGRQTSPTEPGPAVATPARCEVVGSLVFIKDHDFVGCYSRSPNGRYLLAWRDANDAGSRGGARESGHGRYLLIEDGLVVAEGRAERPNDGKVADNGAFILNDWLFYSERLEGVFLAFRKDGSPILSRRFEANLFNNGLAPDGSLAVCQTCNAEDDDGDRLTIFDLEAATELASVRPESGWARDYAFPTDRQSVELAYDGEVRFAYDLTGQFIDRRRWIAAGLAKGDVYLIQRLIAQAGPTPDPADRAAWIEGLGIALSRLADDPRQRALAFKLRGSCFDQDGASSLALADFDAALALDPKIGVKRRADALRKARLEGSDPDRS